MDPLPFIPNQLYKRAHLHDQYGGNRQGGISMSAKVPYIFIFTGKSGEQYGYHDRWLNDNIFSYTGEGREGDMKFTMGNLALREHLNKGKRVFLFDTNVARSFARFVCEVTFFDAEYFLGLDRNNQERKAIKFFLKRTGANIPVSVTDVHKPDYIIDAQNREAEIPEILERHTLVKTRVTQGVYRQSLLHRWEYKCAVTGLSEVKLLIASHIIPWSIASPEQKMDVENGLLLSPTYDALFDQHFISFDNDGRIILSTRLPKSAFETLGVTGNEKILNLSKANQAYLENHRATMGSLQAI